MISQGLARPILLASLGVTLMRLASIAAMGSHVRAGEPDGAVSVITDAISYAPGDPITATVTNGTGTAIAPRGGLVCQGNPWPLGVERLDDAGEWEEVPFPRVPPCVGISVALLEPGESQTHTFAADTSPGTYRVVYPYSATDGSGPSLAMSNAYDVNIPLTDESEGTDSSSPSAHASTGGYLEGQVSIGPLQPVERVGVPPPTPSPAMCTARGLVISQADTNTEVARFALDPDCGYHVALSAGRYRVELDRRGLDFSRNLPRVVTITVGQTRRLDISIDTGLR